MFKPNNFIKVVSFIASASALSLALGYLVLAWTEPASAPYTGNVSAPLNIGATAQTKTGGLNIATVSGNVGIGTATPTAVLHLKAGTTAPNTAPLKLTSGALNTTAEAGAMEYNGTNLYFTNSTPTRYQIDRQGYALSFVNSSFNPADATTYYFGLAAGTPGTLSAVRRIYIPRTGTITKIYLFYVIGTAGTNEQSTVSLRLNDTTDTTITSTLDLSSTSVAVSNTSLSIAVSAGDYVEIKWVTPTWVTNPLTLYLNAVIFIE